MSVIRSHWAGSYWGSETCLVTRVQSPHLSELEANKFQIVNWKNVQPDKKCVDAAFVSPSGQQAFLLENVPCNSGSCQAVGRMFHIHWDQSDLGAIRNATMATFFDIYEDVSNLCFDWCSQPFLHSYPRWPNWKKKIPL